MEISNVATEFIINLFLSRRRFLSTILQRYLRQNLRFFLHIVRRGVLRHSNKSMHPGTCQMNREIRQSNNIRNFLWSGKSCLTKRVLVSWEHMCMAKAAGGWNITDMKIWNRAAVTKLLWCLAKKKDRIWIKWIHAYYIKGQNLFTMRIPTQASWIVQKIIGSAQYY